MAYTLFTYATTRMSGNLTQQKQLTFSEQSVMSVAKMSTSCSSDVSRYSPVKIGMKLMQLEHNQMNAIAQHSRRLFTDVLYRSGRVIAQNLVTSGGHHVAATTLAAHLSTATAHRCKMLAVQHMTSQLIHR